MIKGCKPLRETPAKRRSLTSVRTAGETRSVETYGPQGNGLYARRVRNSETPFASKARRPATTLPAGQRHQGILPHTHRLTEVPA